MGRDLGWALDESIGAVRRHRHRVALQPAGALSRSAPAPSRRALREADIEMQVRTGFAGGKNRNCGHPVVVLQGYLRVDVQRK